jgi:hypothetical protein
MASDKMTLREGYQLAFLQVFRAFWVLFAVVVTGICVTDLIYAVQTYQVTMLWPSALWLPVFYVVPYGCFRISTWLIKKMRQDISAMQDCSTTE